VKTGELFQVEWPHPSILIVSGLVKVTRILLRQHPDRQSQILAGEAALATRLALIKALGRPASDLGQTAEPLIGLGEGSTPAGDDYLLGVIVALGLSGQVERGQGLAESAKVRTTQRSAAWIEAAIQGRVGAPIRDLIEALTVGKPLLPLLEVLVETGGTSGYAFLEGFSEGLAGLSVKRQFDDHLDEPRNPPT
jgi:hypothetical protein